MTSAPAEDLETMRAAAAVAYHDAFAACRSYLQQDSRAAALSRDWFRKFWQRNHEALMIECVLKAVQGDLENARLWLTAQPGMEEKALRQHQYGCGSWGNEQWLIDRLIDITYYFHEDRERVRDDPLVRLLITNDSKDRYDFTVVSVMGVISQGAEGLELEQVYRRYTALRGVKFIRANCGTAKSHEYNATNGTAQMTCGEYKITNFAVEVENFLKHHQVYF